MWVVGERVTFKGHPGEPLPPNQVAKKKIWEVRGDGEAPWDPHTHSV